MKYLKPKAIIVFYLVCLSLCGKSYTLSAQQKTAVKVEVKMVDDSYRMFRNGHPYFIKGAGGNSHISQVASFGGNSIRTWDTNNGNEILDSADKYGLTVLMGLNLIAERHGFNYDDTGAVRKQLLYVKQEILKYRNHPALLAWGIGNELNLFYTNTHVWNVVNNIAKMIHELDPNHPVCTVLAGVNKKEVDYIKEYGKDIDILAVNTYGGLASLPQQLENIGWHGPYMVTEWGPTGHWEGLLTSWKAPIEETSSEKAAVYKSRYEWSVERDTKKCLGSYVFLWGQKQERTPTWYGLFTENGEKSEVIDVVQFLWTGNWPQNQAPHLYSLQIDNKKMNDNIILKPNEKFNALAVAFDPNNDKLTYRWELLPEAVKTGEGGDHEDKPKILESKTTTEGKVILNIPSEEGPYRLFVYVNDGHNNVATGNIPFYVNK